MPFYYYRGFNTVLPDFRYEEIKKIVADIIDKYKISAIPLDVFALAKRMDIRLVRFSDLTDKDWENLSNNGITQNLPSFFFAYQDKWKMHYVIYYNDRLNSGRIRFSILHEIGHIVLKHRQDSDLAEAEANFFAKYMIAPPVLVALSNPSDYIDVENTFSLSGECAWNSFNYYLKWLKIQNKGFCLKDYEEKILIKCSLLLPGGIRCLNRNAAIL